MAPRHPTQWPTAIRRALGLLKNSVREIRPGVFACNDYANVGLLGGFEVLLTIIEMSSSGLELGDTTSMKSAGVAILVMFQILETLMTSVDFFIVAAKARIDAGKLFNTTNEILGKSIL